MQYGRNLVQASRAQLLTFLQDDLRCPIDWPGADLPIDLVEIFLERWSRTIAAHLPEWDESLLSQNFGKFILRMSEPDVDHLSWTLTGTEELRRLAYNTSERCEAYRNAYVRQVNRVTSLRVQVPTEREKHYVRGGLSSHAVRQRSIREKNIGILLPFVSPYMQTQLLWHALADVFDRNWERNRELSQSSVADDVGTVFDAAWDEMYRRSHLRISLNTYDVVGYYAGEEAAWLVFDISFDASIFHCYPSVRVIDEDWTAEFDGLQGAKLAYDSGESVDWLDADQ